MRAYIYRTGHAPTGDQSIAVSMAGVVSPPVERCIVHKSASRCSYARWLFGFVERQWIAVGHRGW